MGVLGHQATDLVQVLLHGWRIGIGHGQAGADAASRTDGSKQIGALVTLIGRLAWPGAAERPLTYKAILLAYPRLVLEPDLDRLVLGKMGQMRLQRSFEVFLNAAIVSGFWPG
ncbi:hypothetical protein GCM10007874_41040 [Labrys miyagiensis]|uniref:Uncharacterized protein n=1 Tax=Labrys miyagiensis TaxID=346912 RepID=A0ABQ6CS37_9HYPH|nr:hypothetical protein GCM10007874_41040 [Labrys miyagiensis]